MGKEYTLYIYVTIFYLISEYSHKGKVILITGHSGS
jgi:hypothetical protein